MALGFISRGAVIRPGFPYELPSKRILGGEHYGAGGKPDGILLPPFVEVMMPEYRRRVEEYDKKPPLRGPKSAQPPLTFRSFLSLK